MHVSWWMSFSGKKKNVDEHWTTWNLHVSYINHYLVVLNLACIQGSLWQAWEPLLQAQEQAPGPTCKDQILVSISIQLGNILPFGHHVCRACFSSPHIHSGFDAVCNLKCLMFWAQIEEVEEVLWGELIPCRHIPVDGIAYAHPSTLWSNITSIKREQMGGWCGGDLLYLWVFFSVFHLLYQCTDPCLLLLKKKRGSKWSFLAEWEFGDTVCDDQIMQLT